MLGFGPITPTLHYSNTPLLVSAVLTAGAYCPKLARMGKFIATMFGLGALAPEKRRALSLVYATSVALVMGVNFIQPALPAIIEPFGISDAALGLVMTMLTLPAIFLAPVFGVVADLFGRRLLLAWGLIVYGIFGAAMAFAPTFAWLLFFRFLQGIAYSAVIPLTIVLISDFLEGDKEIGGQGLKVFLDRVGYMILPPLGGFLATIAWFWPFTFYFLTVPIGVAAFFWLPETKGSNHEGTKAYLGNILRLLRHPRLLIAFSAGFLRFFLDYGFLTYFPLFIVRTHGVSTATAGLLYTFFAAGAMITSSQAGRYRRRQGQNAFAVRRVSRQRLSRGGRSPYPRRLAGRIGAVFLRLGQRHYFADAKKPVDAKCAGGNARRSGVAGPADSANL